MCKKVIWIIILCIAGMQARPQAEAADCSFLIKEGYGYLYRFHAAEALEKFDSAVLLSRQLGNDYFYARALFGAGQATWYAGDFYGAADLVKKALRYFTDKEQGDRIGALRILSNIYDDVGDYTNAFKAVQEAISINPGYDLMNEMLSMIQMGKLYKNIGDYETALDYYRKVLTAMPPKGGYPYRELHHCLGELYVAKGQLDSAHYFYRQAFTGYSRSPIIRLRLGELYLLQNKVDSAFYFFDSLNKDTNIVKDVNIGIGITLGLSMVARARDHTDTALLLAKSAFDRAMQAGIFKSRMDATALLGSLFERKGDISKALYYLQLYHSLKDAATSDIYKAQLFAFKQKTLQAEQAATLASLESEKKLAQRTLVIVALTVGLLTMLLIGLLVFRHHHERSRLKQRAAEMEMQALLAQMNPHFIFNCLTAINHSILNKEPEKASEYLTRFSRLMRMVLVNASKKTISLEEELDMLRLYLAMEQLRFKDAFDYTIELAEDVQPSLVQVPCFILQPFCENAIWHGLLHKEGKGRLLIRMHIAEARLIVSIQDNGVGLAEAALRKTKNTEPMGLKLTATRLALFNEGNKNGSHFSVHDIKDTNGHIGTEAIIRINTRVTYD